MGIEASKNRKQIVQGLLSALQLKRVYNTINLTRLTGNMSINFFYENYMFWLLYTFVNSFWVPKPNIVCISGN
jgi:hypothetical protein